MVSSVEIGKVESFKHHLGHLLSVGFGVKRGFGEYDSMFVGGDTQLATVERERKKWNGKYQVTTSKERQARNL